MIHNGFKACYPGAMLGMELIKLRIMCSINNVSEIEISYKPALSSGDRYKLTSIESAVNVLRSLWTLDINIRESFYLLLVNNPGEVIGWHRIGVGGFTGTTADPRLIFSIALKGMASKIIVAHNHPSGSLQPGIVDKDFTSKLKEASKLLQIELLDHIILTEEGYYSFSQSGIL